MRDFRKYNDVPEPAGQAVLDQVLAQRARLGERLAGIRHVIPIVSGKGGVGKSALTANLAAALAHRGHRVGAVDADLNGPSLARMLGSAGGSLRVGADGIVPAEGAAGVRFVSMDLLLEAVDTPLRWRGPVHDEFLWRGALETGTFREFLADVAWGDLDYLFIDVPPGTDRIQRLLELVAVPAAVLLVTTPSAAAGRVVAKSERLLVDAGIDRIGLVVNMAGCECPHCGGMVPLFDAGGHTGTPIASSLEVWGEIPFDANLAAHTDAGRPPVLDPATSRAAAALSGLADRLARECPP